MKTILQRIAEELSVIEPQVQAAVTLLDEGATVPFIARYRKEATGGLDDSQLRTLEERLHYLRELEERREVILTSIDEQGKLTAELAVALQEADTKTRLEDLYLPYKPKRRTKAQIAKEAGLEPLALQLLQSPNIFPDVAAANFIDVDKGISDGKMALEGARQILMEKFAEEAELLAQLRPFLTERTTLTAKVVVGKEEEGAKFADYFDFQESWQKVPSHRALAMFRGRKEGILQLNLSVEEQSDILHPCEAIIAHHFNIAEQGRAADKWLLDTVRWAWKFKIKLHLDTELMNQLREAAESEAIKVFAGNLRDLLLAAPAGPKRMIGLDPGLRTGVKVIAIDETGKLLQHATIYPHQPHNKRDLSIQVLAKLAEQYQIELISIGNGTASRETDQLVADLIKQYPALKLQKVVVSEAGASVYSASEFASQEFPDLDVSLRGAVSIARRLQDPLAELVKIDPKSIGVGQYQHDVNQIQLASSLNAVVEDCVNAVGVDVNTASVPLLSRVSGLNANLARNIVTFRDANGAFPNRQALKKVSRLGEKTFEQAAGFLRIMNSNNPLDASAVHPEAYPVVEKILAQHHKSLKEILGNKEFLYHLNPADYIDNTFGIPTVTDILKELEKPGRDPRPEFKTATFQENVKELTDLKADMLLEGVVTNVTNFGAFVDIGVHHDGLVHISALSNDFVKDPRDVVKAGDVVQVKVLEVDLKRKRIALTMRLQEQARDQNNAVQKEGNPRNQKSSKGQDQRSPQPSKRASTPKDEPAANTAFGNAFAEAFANARKE